MIALAVAALTLAVLPIAGVGPRDGGPVGAAQAQGSGTRLVLESVDVDTAGIIEPESWTAVPGAARFAPFYGTAEFSFPIPSVIPPDGAPVTLSVTANATLQYMAPALGIHGDATFTGPSTQAGTDAQAGESDTGSVTVTIVPRPATAGTSVLIFIGLQSGPRVNYRFRAEAVEPAGCVRGQELARSLQACPPPPRCAGSVATIVHDPDVPGPIIGTPGRDVIVGSPGRDLILGRGGPDLICGRGGDDRILGNAGPDTVNGEGGNDRIDGGDDEARDRLAGQAGDDNIVGGRGRDLVIGGRGDDRLSGGPGIDRIEAGPGRNESFGGAGADVLVGGPDQDDMDGGIGDDIMNGAGGRDSLLGGAGDDRMFGGTGPDVLTAEEGDDSLYAGPRDEGDLLAGGPGLDLCDGSAVVTQCEILR